MLKRGPADFLTALFMGVFILIAAVVVFIAGGLWLPVKLERQPKPADASTRNDGMFAAVCGLLLMVGLALSMATDWAVFLMFFAPFTALAVLVALGLAVLAIVRAKRRLPGVVGLAIPLVYLIGVLIWIRHVR